MPQVTIYLDDETAASQSVRQALANIAKPMDRRCDQAESAQAVAGFRPRPGRGVAGFSNRRPDPQAPSRRRSARAVVDVRARYEYSDLLLQRHGPRRGPPPGHATGRNRNPFGGALRTRSRHRAVQAAG